MYKILIEYGRNLLPQCALDATGFLNDVSKRNTQTQKLQSDDVQGGKSMIEMLGVLAIIAVLSVGGIAGYSKAMEKYKVNKVINDFNMLIMGVLEHRESFEKTYNDEGVYRIADTIYAMNLVPNTWKLNSYYLSDSMGNLLDIYRRNEFANSDAWNGIIFDYTLGTWTADEQGNSIVNFNDKLCFEMFNNVIIPMHNVFKRGRIYPNDIYIFYGDAYCNGNTLPCLKDLSLTKIEEICNSCNKTSSCHITVNF